MKIEVTITASLNKALQRFADREGKPLTKYIAGVLLRHVKDRNLNFVGKPKN